MFRTTRVTPRVLIAWAVVVQAPPPAAAAQVPVPSITDLTPAVRPGTVRPASLSPHTTHRPVATCGAPDAVDPRAVAVAEALVRTPPDRAGAALRATLDSLSASFGSDPDDDPVRIRYHEAMLLGARIETMDGGERIDATRALHRRALEILAEDPEHPGAHHLLGRMNAAVMRLGGAKRFVARLAVGGNLLKSASWGTARAHLEHAERGAPCMAEHHLELARLLADTDDVPGAQREAMHVLALTTGAAITRRAPARLLALRESALELLGDRWAAAGDGSR